MDSKELVTAADAAAMFSMSVNAFRIYIHRYGRTVRKVRLGKRRMYFFRQDLLALLQAVSE